MPRPMRCRCFPARARWVSVAPTTPSSTCRLRAGDDSGIFREKFEKGILARLSAFAPDLIVISAGFDAHRLDPLASVELDEADFGWATRKLMENADKHAGGRIVSVLEGGYSLDGLARSVTAHMDALMGR